MSWSSAGSPGQVGRAITLGSSPSPPRGPLPPTSPDLPSLRGADPVWPPLLIPPLSPYVLLVHFGVPPVSLGVRIPPPVAGRHPSCGEMLTLCLPTLPSWPILAFSFLKKINFIYFIYYFWLHWVFTAACGLSLVAASGGYSSLWCASFSLQWLLLLWSTGSRHARFSSCGSQAPERRLSSCGAWAQLLRGMWDLPGPGLEPTSPALAGGLSITAPPGKPQPFLNSVI